MASNGNSTARVPFPQTPEEFATDVRVSYDKNAEKWTLEEVDGEEWEWIQAAQRWMPMVRY
jgi:HIV Tat-specific factor 1